MDMTSLTYTQLISSLKGRKPTYKELLSTLEWKAFRKEVLANDDNKCTTCGTERSECIEGKHYRDLTDEEIEIQLFLNEIKYELQEPYYVADGISFKCRAGKMVSEQIEQPLYLHAHHTFYIFGNLPWEYDVSDLTTMCEKCHTDFHKEEKVGYYPDTNKETDLDLTPCKKCSGTGFINQTNYFEGGVCLACKGGKYEEIIGNGIF